VRAPSQEILVSRIGDFVADDSYVDYLIARAFDLLERIIRDGDGLVEDIDRSLKSYTLNEAVDKALYTSHFTAGNA
jgi:hypothetical protein